MKTTLQSKFLLALGAFEIGASVIPPFNATLLIGGVCGLIAWKLTRTP